MSHGTRPCVYTILLGGYEQLNEQPVAARSGVPFICLTDDPALTSESWTIVQVRPAFAMDPIRSQRILKTCPHEVDALRAFDQSLYIDNTVILKEAPEKLFEALPWASGLGLPRHSFRESVHDEFLEVARLGLDDPSRIFEQLNHYMNADGAVLDEKPFWTAILLRRHADPAVQRAMALWRDHILRYSRRDQLSIHAACRAAGLQPDAWTLDNYQSWFHDWPVARSRERFAGPRAPGRTAMPMASELRAARLELGQTQAQLQQAQAERDAAREEAALCARSADALQARCDALTQSLATATEQNRGLAARNDALAQQNIEARQQVDAVSHAFRSSTSWRITAPLRKLHDLWR